MDDAQRAGAAVLSLIECGIRPRDIMTRKSFENAITVVIALGGSTNAILHLLAMAHSANVPLSIDDFTRIGNRVPVLADVKPSGRYLMSELVEIGGIQVKHWHFDHMKIFYIFIILILLPLFQWECNHERMKDG